MAKKPRSLEKKAKRRIKDRKRRAEGTLVSWSYKRRCLTDSGHKSTMLNRARTRAKRKGLSFTIDASHLSIPEICPVLGIKLSLRIGKRGPCDSSPTLDRIDSSKGYTPENVEVISWRANRIKCDATPEELSKVARYYGKKIRK